MAYNRAHIYFKSPREVSEFIRQLNIVSPGDKYIIENFDGSYKIDARSYMGVMYAFVDFNENIFLANLSTGEIPSFVDEYRI